MKRASSQASTCLSMVVSLSFSAELAGCIDSRLAQLAEHAPRTAGLLDAHPALAAQARQVVLGSDFALRTMMRDDDALETLWRDGALAAARNSADYAKL